MEGKTMKRFFRKQLPAILLALTMMVSLVPAAMAVDCTLNGQEHTYGSWSVTTKPTCTDAGVQERICSVCDAKDTGSVEPLGHDFSGEGTTTKSPTCTEPGILELKCSRCGATTTRIIDPLGHKWNWEVTQEATCQAPGVETGTCSVCNAVDTKPISQKEHRWNSGVITTLSTCTTTGVKTFTCQDCGTTKTESVAALGHVDSNNDGKCDRCGVSMGTYYTASFYYLTSSLSAASTNKNVVANSYPSAPSITSKITSGGKTYTFVGWTTDCSGSSWYLYKSQSLVNPSSYRITGNTTFYAVYSTASDSTITYTVAPGKEESFSASDFNSAYKGECSGTFRYVTFSVSSSAYNSFEGDIYCGNTKLSRSELTSSKFYYSSASHGDYALGDLSLVAPSSADKDTLTLSFTAYGSSGYSMEGTVELVIDGKGSGDITYKVAAGKEVAFDEDDFNDVFQEEYPNYNMKYVTFSTSDTLSTSEGTIYYDYGYSDQKSFTKSTIDDYTFYYGNNSSYDYPLDELSFVAGKNASDHTVELSFRAYYNSSRYVDGTLTIEVGDGGSSSDITYKVAAGKEAAFDEDDFNKVFQKEYSSYDIKYVTFSTSATLSTSEGTVYYDYGYSDEKSFTKSTIDDYKFYYGKNTSSGDYALDDLSFVAGKNASKRTVELSFRAYYNSSKYVDGTLTIEVGSSSSADITYKVAPGKEVAFDEDDFNSVYRKEYSSGTIKWVEFTAPSTLTSAGTIYYDYGRSDQKSFTRSTLNSAKFYYGTSSSYGDYALDDLSFVASSSFNAAVELSFRAYYSESKYVDGTVVLQPDGTAASSNYIGNIRYSTTTGTKVQINANDISRFFSKVCPGYTMQYVMLTGVPSTGSLYYNYYGTSKYGTTAKAQITASNCGGQAFYASPTSTSQFALTELTYVPSGSNYCASIPFTAYSGSRSVSGAILISVSNSTVAEVYGATPKNTAVTFPASSIYNAVLNATGSALSSIQLLSLPSYTTGTVYVGTGTSTAANTTTQYTYGGTMNQLRFVPATGYTGSVEIPYVALNSNGTAIASGTFSLGVVNSVKKFSDVTTSTWCYKYVAELSDASVIAGYNDGTFKPNSTVTYGAALKLIMLAAGYPEQKPVNSNVFSGYLAKARAEGIITRSNVDLTKPITRLQVAQLAAGALKLNTSNLSSVKPFTDTNDASVQALNAAGIVEGYFSNGTSTYKPNNTLTRGQVSAIVWRMQNYRK